MTELCRCSSCKGLLEPAQQLRFLVETDTLDDPAYLARIRTLPSKNGRPLPFCKACQTELEATPRPPAKPPLAPRGLLGALGAALLLGSIFTSRG